MSRTARAALCMLAASAMVAAPGADAKPARRCPLMVDATGDAGHQDSIVGDDPSLDFVSADIASDSTRLTVVMRVVELRLPSPGSPSGVMYDYGITVNDTEFVLAAHHSTARGARFELRARRWTTVGPLDVFQQDRTDAVVDGVFDEDLGEIRMTVALKDMPGVRPGDKVTRFRLMSWIEAEEAGASTDHLDQSGQVYAVGSPGCVRVGT